MEQDVMRAAARSAARMNVEPEALAAVALVESGGAALTSVNNRLEPLIRFEGHYFDRRLNTAQKAKARALGLASPIAGAVKNPAGQTARWHMLDQAAAISSDAAFESASYGIGQVMGAHWRWLGYPSVQALVDEARSGIDGQMRLMEKYIEKSGLTDALRRKDWSAFAKGYNGPGYRSNAYDRKLADTYVRLKNALIKISPRTPPIQKSILLKRGMRGAAILDMQQMLSANGYATPADGVYGAGTEYSVRHFQTDAGLNPDGIFGPDTKRALEAATAPSGRRHNFWIWLKTAWHRLSKSI